MLVVANNSFSLTNANGRTLGNMFVGWPKDCLAEFCISTDGADFDICDNYYCISDQEMLSAFLLMKKARGHKLEQNKKEYVATGIYGKKKTAFRSVFRHLLWSCNRWRSKEMENWVSAFNPEAILVMNGDAAFILSIARKISKEKGIPLLMFNTEGYCLFEHDWMYRGVFSLLGFPIYKRLLRRETQITMNQLKFIIHGNQLLKDDFDRVFDVPSEVVYTSSNVQWSNKPFNTDAPKIVYLGNFGYNRPNSLALVAKVLRSISPNYNIDVYGKPRTAYQEYILTHSDGVVFHGAVPYEEVKTIMSTADILLHVEGIDEDLQESLRYGFSTKIADCLSSGRPFFLFSRPDIACAQYIRHHGVGWFASDETGIREELTSLINNKDDRIIRLERAHSLAIQNHSMDKCRMKFQSIIKGITTEQESFS